MGESIKDPAEESAERTVVRDMSFLGASWGANACMVDVKDGKILRIRPARFYDKYTKEEVKPWVMHARGKTFEPGDKTLPPPLSIAYKKRVFSPARIRYPMKRVDFDPKGERNIQNRGVSKYERISWDEALDIITSEMLRVKETYGPTAILYQNDQHGENKVVHGPTVAVASCCACSAASPTRSATPTAGRAGGGAPSTCGVASRSASRRPSRTCSMTSPRTRSSCCSGAATRRPPPGAGAGSCAAGSATGGRN